MELTVVQWLSSITAAILIYLCFRSLRHLSEKRLPLPPGPKRLPLLGNLLQLPTFQEWETYHDWCQELDTDILYLNAAGTHLVVLDTLNAASEVFEKNTATCSGRLRLPMIRELLGWEDSFSLKDYGDTWYYLYRVMADDREMGPDAVKRFRSHQDRACKRLLQRFCARTVDLAEELRHLTGEITLGVTYGIDIKSRDDYWLRLVEDAVQPVVEAFTPGAFLVDAFPVLKYMPSWFPGASFKRKAKIGFKKRADMFKATYWKAKEISESGIFSPSFVAFSLEQHDVSGHERDIQAVAGSIYGAAGDTTFTALMSAVHLLNHPEAVKCAQEEMDNVLGIGSLPTYEDESVLPITSSLIKEIQRWRTPIPLGVPHLAMEELVYKGYRIPEGSIVMGNSWAILRDQNLFQDADIFKPDRYLASDSKSINKDIPDPSISIYGFGRRICPGRYLAGASMWITLSSLIAAFDFQRVDETGGLDHPMRSGCLNLPEPFKMRFEPRSKAIKQLIHHYQD